MEQLKKTSTHQFKLCYTCGRLLPYQQFHKYSKAKDGLHTVCKDCRAEWGKHYRATPRGKEVLKSAKQTYSRTHKGRLAMRDNVITKSIKSK